MFCPKCKAIISKKRINGQLVEFCNCPDKLESNYIAQTITEPKRKPQGSRPSQKSQVITYKERSKKKFTTIQESTFKPKREPSEYSSLAIELRLSKNARLPTFWKQQTIQNRLIQQIDDLYERYYRKIEDYFSDTQLRLFISFVPNETLNDFSIDHWGLAFGAPDFKVFYAGTKLNDLASWDSRVLEKEVDVITPYRLFNNFSRKLDYDRLNLQQLVDILKSDWLKYTTGTDRDKIRVLPLSELYEKFREKLF